MDISVIVPDFSEGSIQNQCEAWCSNNDTCGGFVIWNITCYAKNKSCADDIQYAPGYTAYLKQGG